LGPPVTESESSVGHCGHKLGKQLLKNAQMQ
jgi:hypothetical protein